MPLCGRARYLRGFCDESARFVRDICKLVRITFLAKETLAEEGDDMVSKDERMHSKPRSEDSAGKKKSGAKKKASDTRRIELGRRGEEAAAQFLEREGMEIIARNFTCKAGEADIVALDEDALHFIEVKTRKSAAKGFPEEAVTKEKRRRYECIAEMFLREYDGFETRITFDIISIIVTGPDQAYLRFHRNVLSSDCRG